MADIKALLKYILDTKGAYGARRVERAADEIPGLSRLYKDRALEEAFASDNGSALMTMPPGDFEKYAAPIGDNQVYRDPLAVRPSGPLSEKELLVAMHPKRMSREEYIAALGTLQKSGGYNDVPFLGIDDDRLELLKTDNHGGPYISAHEGRHRMRAAAALDEPQGLVVLKPRSNIREPIPRREQQEFIDGLRAYLHERSAPLASSPDDVKLLVRPEAVRDQPDRPRIELPEPYAGGGKVSALTRAVEALSKGAAKKRYPMADKGAWYGDANFDQTGGRLEQMSPDQFLSLSRPMTIDDFTRENIEDLKRHILEGGELDPLALYKGGKEDGRHRARAAKELGLDEVPVLNWRGDND